MEQKIIRQLIEKRNASENTDKDVNGIFPLQTLDDLNRFEREVLDSQYYGKVVSERRIS